MMLLSLLAASSVERQQPSIAARMSSAELAERQGLEPALTVSI
jgi:hypothetical protein